MKVSPTAPRRGGNPEARKLTNPVASNAESIAAGKRLYSRLCVRCHGPLGKGDGGGAGAGGQPSDLTDATWDFGSSDGEIFAVIHDGTSADMESYAEQMTDTEIWTVIVFLRSIGPKPNVRSVRLQADRNSPAETKTTSDHGPAKAGHYIAIWTGPVFRPARTA